MENQDRPLVSFCLKSYNQKNYLVEALKGAFAQTYRPLEIVISDDGSTDGSWEYIQEVGAEFGCAHDDVSVVMNRNSTNLGNMGNWLKCCELSHGELLIKADGDDVSLPERTSTIVSAWVKGEKRAAVISHAFIRMSPTGMELGCGGPVGSPGALGAAQAYRRDCWFGFGGVLDNRNADDLVFTWRALMVGEELLMPDVLVKYRIGAGECSVYAGGSRKSLRRSLSIAIESAKQALNDWTEFQRRCPKRGMSMDLEAKIQSSLAHAQLYLTLVTSKSLRTRWEAYKKVAAVGLLNWRRYYQVIYLLPEGGGDFILGLIVRIKWFLKEHLGMR